MMQTITFVGIVALAAVSASPANPFSETIAEPEPLLEGWNELLNGDSLFDDSLNTIQAKATPSVLLQSLEDLLGQDNILENVYSNYRAQFKYSSDASSSMRAQLFKTQLLEIAAHNLEEKSGLHGWSMGVNQFTDMTSLEMDEMASRETYDDENESSSYASPSEDAPPTSLSYSERGQVAVARNSKGGGSSAVFAIASVVESVTKIKSPAYDLVSLSEQQLLDCVSAFCTMYLGICTGTEIEMQFIYIGYRGLVSYNEYPYNDPPTTGTCKDLAPYATLNQMTPYTFTSNNTEVQLKQMLTDKGPLLVRLYFSSKLTKNYAKGVYPGKECKTNAANTAVSLVGYGTENGKDYWLVKHSIGQKWGVQGFLKLARDGTNVCQILTSAYAANK